MVKFYYIYRGDSGYEIYPSVLPHLLGTYIQNGLYVFAAFTRSIDAARYVEAENKR